MVLNPFFVADLLKPVVMRSKAPDLAVRFILSASTSSELVGKECTPLNQYDSVAMLWQDETPFTEEQIATIAKNLRNILTTADRKTLQEQVHGCASNTAQSNRARGTTVKAFCFTLTGLTNHSTNKVLPSPSISAGPKTFTPPSPVMLGHGHLASNPNAATVHLFKHCEDVRREMAAYVNNIDSN